MSKTSPTPSPTRRVVRGKDGWWYAYGTTDPLREGEKHAPPHPDRPVARPGRLDATSATPSPRRRCPPGRRRPRRAAALGAGRPLRRRPVADVLRGHRDHGHRQPANDNAIGMATAPRPSGPWTDSGAPVVGPRGAGGGSNDFLWTFDPSAVTDPDGSQWIFYGLLRRHLGRPLLDDGRRTVPAPDHGRDRQQVRGRVRRAPRRLLVPLRLHRQLLRRPHDRLQRPGRRSTDLRGPYVDREGSPADRLPGRRHPGPDQNGNRWIGAGHNAIAHRRGRPGLDRLPRHRPRATRTSTSPSASTSGRC